MLHSNLWGADADVTVQEVVSDFKLVTCIVENVLPNNQRVTVNNQSKAKVR